MILEAAPGAHAAIAAWDSRHAWILALADFLVTDLGDELRRKHRVAVRTLLDVAGADARRADSSTGRNVGTSNATVGREIGRTSRTVQRARAFLEEAGWSVTVVPGRYMTSAERRRAGKWQLRAASTRALTTPQSSPPRRPRNRSRSSNVVPPRRGYRPAQSHDSGRNTKTGVDNPQPLPIGVQRLAAGLVARMPRLAAHCHIGRLGRALNRAAIPPGITPARLIASIEAGLQASGRGWLDPNEQHDPLSYFLHLLATTPLVFLDPLRPSELPPRGDPMHPYDRPKSSPLDCTPARTAQGWSHRYDPVSGWCIHGCGVRDDGRVIGQGGNILRPGIDHEATIWEEEI